jgi:hypothetical protein
MVAEGSQWVIYETATRYPAQCRDWPVDRLCFVGANERVGELLLQSDARPLLLVSVRRHQSLHAIEGVLQHRPSADDR